MSPPQIAQPVTEGVPVDRVVDNADARDLPRLPRPLRERPRGRRAAEPRDELAAFQLPELHWCPPARAGLKDIELARISQEVMERFYNLLIGPTRFHSL